MSDKKEKNDSSVISGSGKVNRKLRSGYTTGSCASAAAKAASYMLLNNMRIDKVKIDTPAGTCLAIAIEDIIIKEDYVSCAVRKDSGDDPDITNGILVYAKAQKIKSDIKITGGIGIGIVTKPGLDQPVGQYAINSTPRRMIYENVNQVIFESSYDGGIEICISIPKGEEIANKTFNPRMGIVGGISIIGTTGIVEPMSNKALLDTIKLEINQKKELGLEKIYITPGKIGSEFLASILDIDEDNFVLCSNFVADAIEYAYDIGFKDIVLVGHIGKLVKLGYGARNTHSFFGDGRIEELLRCALKAGADAETLMSIDDCITTDAVIAILKSKMKNDKTMEILADNVYSTLCRWVDESVKISCLCFTGKKDSYEVLFKRG